MEFISRFKGSQNAIYKARVFNDEKDKAFAMKKNINNLFQQDAISKVFQILENDYLKSTPKFLD